MKLSYFLLNIIYNIIKKIYCNLIELNSDIIEFIIFKNKNLVFMN
jgi:hypothetical protein